MNRLEKLPLSRRKLAFSLLTLLTLLLFAESAFAGEQDAFAKAVAEGPITAGILAFGGGLLVAGTGCVYPMIAITVSIFGAKEAKSRWHGVMLSGAFVLGIVAMFVPIGLFAGYTGSVFGSALQNKWLVTAIALLFFAMAASMLGAFEFALPSGLTNRLTQIGGSGPKGAFALGMVCGIIAAPCTGPILVSILLWIATEQSVALGAAAMTAFSLGLGFPFFLVGAFAVHLPKSGVWMMHIKSLLAIILSVTALNFLSSAFPELVKWIAPQVTTALVAVLVVLIGLTLGAVHREFSKTSLKDTLLKGVGTFLTVLAGFVLVSWWRIPDRELDWKRIPVEQAALTARSESQPMLVDFTAAWCGACKDLDKKTFADPEVNREAGRFLAVKVDATDDEDPVVVKTMDELNVVGLPTVLLFDSKGQEVKRFTDFVDAEAFLSALRDVN